MWTKDRPEKEGWYFWKRTEPQKMPFRFRAYYIVDGECWEGGTMVEWPAGGWWKKNTTWL